MAKGISRASFGFTSTGCCNPSVSPFYARLHIKVQFVDGDDAGVVMETLSRDALKQSLGEGPMLPFIAFEA